ncbi:TRAP transporter substrate-binding protein [Kaustia mangrovi]|uniref:TRAP transporter substrate-binding protein n=1 Tax=Kaustia mangrovi TaxID=2593653 RepID=A0A7S8C570_9HYPH|nr:TRAP transporter substrate-binding protein [Kaustia mangrovi]QPC43625.1 TRAP transporter substrate-binding protein [Kaustia mangrovi]
MRIVARALGVAVAAALFASPALAQELTLRFGHVGAPGSLFEISAKEFAKRANEKLGDKAEVQVFGASQLGKDQEMLQKLKLGQITFSLPSTVMSSVADEFGIFEMPYIIKDRAHMKRVRDAILDSHLQPAAKEKGYRIIGVWENGFRNITNNTRPINTPEDLQGIKLRTPKGAWRVKMFKLYGANPTPMSFSEVFTALKTGVIDGQENPLAQIWSAKFQEVQKYLSMTGHVYTPAYVLVSDAQFAKLPEDVQTILVETAQELQDYVYEQAARLDVELLEKLKAGGIEVNEADREAFVAASTPIYEEFTETVEGGGELIETVQSLADAE